MDSRFPVITFAVSRLGLFLVMYLGMVLVPSGQPYDLLPEYQMHRDNLWLHMWARWDANWYWDIAEHGYTNQPKNGIQRDTAFFPLYPLLVRGVRWLVGDTYVAGVLVAQGALLVAMVLLYRLVAERHSEDSARRATVLLVAWPFSFFLGQMYTESTFLLFAVAAFYLGERQRWVWAGLCAAAAGATRVAGFVTTLGLVVLYLEQRRFRVRQVRWDVLWVLLGLLGPGAYMLFLHERFGDGLLFVRSQFVPGWGAGEGLHTVVPTLREALSWEALRGGRFPAMRLLNLGAWLAGLGLCVHSAWRTRVAYGVWGLLVLLASATLWRSGGRFTAPVFPLFVSAGLLLRNEYVYGAVLYTGLLLLSLLTLLFTHWYFVA